MHYKEVYFREYDGHIRKCFFRWSSPDSYTFVKKEAAARAENPGLP